jgi:hypothetical protein
MGKCRNHPNRETSYVCSKYTSYMCEECFQCSDPEIYCKFRTACPIWFVEKEKSNRIKKKQTCASAAKFATNEKATPQ